ncbi:hypothetical protein BH09PSE2_BH09PSE2_12420 [soil metagenome]
MGKAGVMRAGLAGAALTALLAGAGCGGKQYLAVNDAGAHTALPQGAADTAAPVGATPPVQPSRVSTPAADQCGAASLQYLVGKPKTEIPVAIDPSRRRVTCTTCPTTRDLRLDRQTILYDEATKLVTSVTCG